MGRLMHPLSFCGRVKAGIMAEEVKSVQVFGRKVRLPGVLQGTGGSSNVINVISSGYEVGSDVLLCCPHRKPRLLWHLSRMAVVSSR
jgi:hypothetical protein